MLGLFGFSLLFEVMFCVRCLFMPLKYQRITGRQNLQCLHMQLDADEIIFKCTAGVGREGKKNVVLTIPTYGWTSPESFANLPVLLFTLNRSHSAVLSAKLIVAKYHDNKDLLLFFCLKTSTTVLAERSIQTIQN